MDIEQKKSKSKIVIIVLIIILLIVSGLGGYFGYKYYKLENKNNCTNESLKDNSKENDEDVGYTYYAGYAADLYRNIKKLADEGKAFIGDEKDDDDIYRREVKLKKGTYVVIPSYYAEYPSWDIYYNYNSKTKDYDDQIAGYFNYIDYNGTDKIVTDGIFINVDNLDEVDDDGSISALSLYRAITIQYDYFSDGDYLVGEDIYAGTYSLEPSCKMADNFEGDYSIYEDGKEVTSGKFSKKITVKVKDGQYLKIHEAEMEMIDYD